MPQLCLLSQLCFDRVAVFCNYDMNIFYFSSLRLQVTDFDGNTLEKTDHVTYVSSKTPTINQIDPSDAGTGGGKTVKYLCS